MLSDLRASCGVGTETVTPLSAVGDTGARWGAVEALFDVEDSKGLTEPERRRVLEKVGPVVRAVAQDERSQLRNRELATDRILEQLRAATKVRRKRRATRPTKASKERRLDDKKRRGQTKRLRRDVED